MRAVINYHALTVAILTGCTVETAFEKLQSTHPDRVTAQLSPSDRADMKLLKSYGLTYKEIGEIYGISNHGAYNHIRRLEGRI